MITLFGRRIMLRPLVPHDFAAWAEVRIRNEDWLLKWEPMRIPGYPDPTRDRDAFVARCAARERERQLGAGYGFGIFVDGEFAGEINVNSVHRGPFQNAYVGYWIDERHAGHSYVSEAVIVVCKYAFEELRLHRLQISIIPRNRNSHRVMEKVNFRNEGTALRYLEINGVWEDHVRYAITSEDWAERSDELSAAWL
ncbi:MAG: GNAT family N-acetyltransferase [Acidimicrobiia bacterium]